MISISISIITINLVVLLVTNVWYYKIILSPERLSKEKGWQRQSYSGNYRRTNSRMVVLVGCHNHLSSSNISYDGGRNHRSQFQYTIVYIILLYRTPHQHPRYMEYEDSSGKKAQCKCIVFNKYHHFKKKAELELEFSRSSFIVTIKITISTTFITIIRGSRAQISNRMMGVTTYAQWNTPKLLWIVEVIIGTK